MFEKEIFFVGIFTLKCEIIFRTSSSKPRSIIRSASSKHKYRQTSKNTNFLSSISIKRPGVATIICTPLIFKNKQSIHIKIMIFFFTFLLFLIDPSSLYHQHKQLISIKEILNIKS